MQPLSQRQEMCRDHNFLPAPGSISAFEIGQWIVENNLMTVGGGQMPAIRADMQRKRGGLLGDSASARASLSSEVSSSAPSLRVSF
jgi:hypothetical protein